MNISINNINFQAGLNAKILLAEKFIIPKNQEIFFADKYGIEANFSENKSAALANKLCINIFEELAKKLNKFFNAPPVVKIYNRNDLVDKTSATNFCIPDTKQVLNSDYPFPGRSIFFEMFQKLTDIDDITEFQYKNKKTSSSHFLAPFIHEWLHSMHLDYIYNMFGYGGSCDYLNEIYPLKGLSICGYKLLEMLGTRCLSQKENEIIYDVLGEYATLPHNQYLEIFSETFTKFICDSLLGTKLVKNPLDELKKTSQEFQTIIRKVCCFK